MFKIYVILWNILGVGGAGNNSSELCYEGHTGALCEACDLDGDYWPVKWSTTEPFICGLCSDSESKMRTMILI